MHKVLNLAILAIAGTLAGDLAVQFLPATMDFGGIPVRRYAGALGGIYLASMIAEPKVLKAAG